MTVNLSIPLTTQQCINGNNRLQNDIPSDVFMFYRLSGQSPFVGVDQKHTFSLVSNVDYDFDDDIWDIVSDNAKDFIKMLLIKNKEYDVVFVHCSMSIAKQW